MGKKNLLIAGAIIALSSGLQSCGFDDDMPQSQMRPTALVTVCPQTDKSVLLQLDNETTLNPVNMRTSPYGEKEVRALVNYTPVSEKESSNYLNVNVNWIDSIRTKMPVILKENELPDRYGNDPLEIINDWVTVAEDGYITLRVRTLWNPTGQPHSIDLIANQNPENPMEFELRHNAFGDTSVTTGDALVAFNLNSMIDEKDSEVKVTLKWNSFSGEKTAEFSLSKRNSFKDIEPNTTFINRLK